MKLNEKSSTKFLITTELGPVRGVDTAAALEKASGYVGLDGINVHDCPMGNLRINATAMASLIQRHLKVDAVPHFTCRDRSLLGTQADLLGAHALGIRHILVTTGDPPKHGPYPSKPVYDYNTFELIRLIRKMNNGLDYNEKEFGGATEFSIACTAAPEGKKMEAELSRMAKKIEAGADFFQTQVAYDAQITISFLKQAKKMGKPVIVGVMPLKSVKMARFVTRNVDGISVPDHIIDQMEKTGATGVDIACEFVREIKPYADGIHIMAMGDVAGTNRIVDYINGLP